MSQRAMTVHKGDAVATTAEPDVSIGMTFDGMVAMGDKLVRTGFLPEHIKNGAQAAAIILAGRELGMPMMRSLRSLALVKGKVSEYADSQLSRFKADGGHAKFLELTPQKAVLWLRHPNGDEHTEEWTTDDTKAAGLAGGMHSKYAKAMNRSRAITAGLKSIGWEGGVGTYDPEEAAEFAPPTVVQMPAEPRRVEPEPEPVPRQSVRAVLDTIAALRHETLDAFATWIAGKIGGYSEAEQKQIRGAYSAKSKALKAEAAAEKQRQEEAAQRAPDAADAADAEAEVIHAGND